jgi:hypothetical protein
VAGEEVGVGTTVEGGYQLREVAGDEVLGRVWFARDERRGRTVRLKMLRRDHLLDDQRFRRFQREIEAHGRVKSPGLLPLLDSGVHDGLAYAVFPGVREHTLGERVKRGPTPWREVVAILSVVVVGLGALHREGVVHRDLIAHNVLFDDDNRPWIRDLGLVWLVSTDDDTGSITDGDGRVGHLAAMAPEYLAQQQLTPAADLYALGVLAFELLTGGPPFEGQGNGLVRLTLGAVAPAPSSRVGDVPAWLDALVLQLLEKDPALRPAPDAILARLQRGVAEEVRPPSARRWWAYGGLVAATVLGVAGLAGWAWRDRSGASEEPGLKAAAEALPAPEEIAELWILPAERAQASPRMVRTIAEAQQSAPAVVAARAGVLVRSNQRALVTLDGQPVGFTPIRLHGVAGVHRLQIGLPARPETRRDEEVTFRDGAIGELTYVF